MTLHTWWLFTGAVFLLSGTPGPNMLHILSRSVEMGMKRSIAAMAGCLAAVVTVLAASAAGLTTLLLAVPGAFEVLRYAGVAYLIYLAYKLWTAPADAPEATDKARGEGFKLFLGGLALTLGNAKVMVFFVSILPLVVDLAAITPLIAVEVAAMMMVILSVAMWTYALVAARARRFISSPRMMRLVNRGTGTMMAGAAVAVAARS